MSSFLQIRQSVRLPYLSAEAIAIQRSSKLRLSIILGDNTGHRGFGFVTFSQNSDALDAIDNMHLNELNGKVGHTTLRR
jgi:RNA recognition motif-containing protein